MNYEFKVSQSMMKSYKEYKAGELCGLVFQAKYFDGLNFESTEAQAVGNYFEYIILGNLPRNGKVPDPVCTQKGEHTAPYKRISEQAKVWDRIVKHYNIKILERGLKMETDGEEGTWDFTGEMPPAPGFAGGAFIGDVKTTGLMENKWDDMGWAPEQLPYREKIMTQPTHYKYMSKKLFGKELPFIFFVFSNKDLNSAIYNVTVDEAKMIEHEQVIQHVRDSITIERKIGFKAIPSMNECQGCVLRPKCKFAIDVPKIVQIYY